MSFDWREYLRLAETLADEGKMEPVNEAKLRASASRAYYAALIAARNFLRDHEGHTDMEQLSVHSYVRNEFANSSDLERQSIGRNLNRLRLARVEADYDDVWTLTPDKIDFLLVQADDVFEDLAAL